MTNDINQGKQQLSEDLLESIYVVNKHAKKEAEKATTNYQQNRKQEAKHHSNRKKALYITKRQALQQIQHTVEKITIDTIDSTNYYCLYFHHNGDFWAFHTPQKEFRLQYTDPLHKPIKQTLSDFSKTTTIPEEYKTLKQALLYLKTHLQINANNHLPTSTSSLSVHDPTTPQTQSHWYFL